MSGDGGKGSTRRPGSMPEGACERIFGKQNSVAPDGGLRAANIGEKPVVEGETGGGAVAPDEEGKNK